ncbi:MAG TPA: hypothetical protein VNW92_19375, partial [Polyangiaceae bacterium]|nr:hypothetical protein [Polyangiaceae bacterium]
LKDPRSYEFLPAAWTGRRSRIVLGKHSGVSSIAHVLRERGLPPGGEEENRTLLEQVKHHGRMRPKDLHFESHLTNLSLQSLLLGGVSADVVLREAGLTRVSGIVRRETHDSRADYAALARAAGE